MRVLTNSCCNIFSPGLLYSNQKFQKSGQSFYSAETDAFEVTTFSAVPLRALFKIPYGRGHGLFGKPFIAKEKYLNESGYTPEADHTTRRRTQNFKSIVEDNCCMVL